MFLDHLTNLNKNYHVIIHQLNNSIAPTRHLRQKFIANSRRIKNATEQLNLGLISIWQFLERCSYGIAEYEQRLRNWERNHENDGEAIEDEPQVQVLQPPLHVPEQLPGDILQLPNQSSGGTCLVCIVATVENSAAQYIILPCGHAWLCSDCIIQLEGPNSLCPLCRITPVTFQRIFFS